MKQENNNPSIKLVIVGFGLIITVFIMSGFVSLFEINTLGNLISTIYKHPLEVSNASLQAGKVIIDIHRDMKDVVLSKDLAQLLRKKTHITKEEKEVYEQLDLIQSKILGSEGQELTNTARQLFANWKPIREEVFALIKKGDRDKAVLITQDKGADHVLLLEKTMADMTSYARNKADGFIAQANLVEKRVLFIEIIIIILGPLTSIAIAFFIIRQLRTSFAKSIKDRDTLEENEEKLSLVIEGANLGYWDWQVQADNLTVNDRWLEILGLEREKFGGKITEWTERLHPEDRLQVEPAIREHIETHRRYEVDFRMRHKNGHWVWIQGSGAGVEYDPVTDKPIRACGTHQDITKQKLAEDELRLQSEIITNMAEGVYLVRLDDAVIVYTNPKFEKMFGYSPGEMIGRHVSIVNAPTGKKPKETAEEILKVIQETEEWHGEVNNTKKDGTSFWCYANVTVLEHQKFGKVLVAVHSDITDRKQAQNLLQQSKEEWVKTFNAMSDIITIQDKDMHIIRANKAAQDFFEADYSDLAGKYCYEVFSGTSEPCPGCPGFETLQDAQSHANIVMHEKLKKFFNVSSAPVFDEKGDIQYLIHTAKDITEQKKLEKELFQAHKMEAIGTLAGGIAHDFNNILSVIIGYSEIAKSDIRSGTGNPEKDIDQVLTASNRATELVKQILTFSRKTEHQTLPLSPHLIVKEALKMLRASLPTTISIQQDIDSECGRILADPTNIHQIVVNLCTNAIHAMEDEKGRLSIRLRRKDVQAGQAEESYVVPGSFIVLSISDTGHGMEQETIKRIFEPYFTTKEKGKGTGLGLAVIHGIIKGYKGFIEVESEQGKGTTFHVYIPAMEKDSCMGDESLDKDIPLPSGTERVLVVDDEDIIVNMNKTVLERLGYQVTTTTDSMDALEKIRTNPDQFDLMITDQTMPNMTGSELAQEVLRIKPNMLIILCTGYSSVITEDGALEIGIRQYARKPVSRATFAQIVRQVLDGK